MLPTTQQRQHIRDLVFFLAFALGIILIVLSAILREGVFFVDVLGLLTGVGGAVLVLRRMREPINWGRGIDRTWETREQFLLTYVQSFGKVGFKRIITVELVLLLGLLTSAIIHRSYWRNDYAVLVPIMMILLAYIITLGLCWLTVYLRIILSWRHSSLKE
jgi:hypothetical protein